MKIGIDARLYGPKATGIGRYVKNLVLNLLRLDTKNQYVLFGGPELQKDIERFPNAKYVFLNTRVYSFAEQLVNPYLFSKEKLDVLHVPHFNSPILYSGKLVVTIHDLIKHLSVGESTTTLPGYQYRIKHQVYKWLVSYNMKVAKHIIVPSFYWKDYLVRNFKLSTSKISVTYEAVNDKSLEPVAEQSKNIISKYQLNQPFVVYLGNLYPHKNVNVLIKAIAEFNRTHEVNLELVLIGARSAFVERLPKDENLKVLGFVPDEELGTLLSQSLCLVQPSLIEGFGLTGLEAMLAHTPVISSSASCLPEVYQDAALYFDPYDINDLVLKLDMLVKDQNLRQQLISEGKNQVKLYSWRKMAKETLAVYEKITQ
jgi:glycosyltransferase involved in cell wall biosynthesis